MIWVCQSPLSCASPAHPSGHDTTAWCRRGGGGGESGGGAGGQDIASLSGRGRIEALLVEGGAEPSPRGEGGRGGALRDNHLENCQIIAGLCEIIAGYIIACQ